MANFQPVETQQVAFTSADKFATFGDVGGGGGVQAITLFSDQDCYVDFDTPAVSSRSFLLPATNSNGLFLDFHGASVQQIHVIRKTQNGNLYLIGVRN